MDRPRTSCRYRHGENWLDFGPLLYRGVTMYYRDPDHMDLDRLANAVGSVPRPKPLLLPNRLILSFGMIVAPVAGFFLILGIGRLIRGL